MDWSGLRDGLLASFGEPVTVTVNAVQSPLTAAFLAPYTAMDISGVPVNRPDPQIVARRDAWEALAPAAGDTVTRGSTVYTIVDVMPDDADLVTVTLRRYA